MADKVTKGGSRTARAMALIVGMIALAIGLVQSWSAIRLARTGAHAAGRVIVERPDPGETWSPAHPTIEFRTATGALVRYSQNGMGARRIGTKVDVLYDPAAPAGTAVVNSFWQLWLPPMLPLYLGIGFTGLVLAGVKWEIRGGRW